MHHRTFLDPTGEHEAVTRRVTARPRTLEGISIGILDIGKARGDVYLNQLARRMTERGLMVKRYAKPTPSRLASPDTKARMKSEVQVAVIGLAD